MSPPHPRKNLNTVRGFTLAELLISLAILGVIATFTIPKILSTQQNSSYNAAAKEVAGMIGAAFVQYQASNEITSNFNAGNLTPYMNYVSVITSAPMDDVQNLDRFDCSATYPCLKLHNGGLLRFRPTEYANGTALTNGVWFVFDPDGQYSGTLTGPGKAVLFFVYTNGFLTSWQFLKPNSCTSVVCFNPTPSYDPPWFSWN